jgi:hypothetical protein
LYTQQEKAKAMEKKDATIITILMTIITCHTIEGESTWMMMMRVCMKKSL